MVDPDPYKTADESEIYDFRAIPSLTELREQAIASGIKRRQYCRDTAIKRITDAMKSVLGKDINAEIICNDVCKEASDINIDLFDGSHTRFWITFADHLSASGFNVYCRERGTILSYSFMHNCSPARNSIKLCIAMPEKDD